MKHKAPKLKITRYWLVCVYIYIYMHDVAQVIKLSIVGQPRNETFYFWSFYFWRKPKLDLRAVICKRLGDCLPFSRANLSSLSRAIICSHVCHGCPGWLIRVNQDLFFPLIFIVMMLARKGRCLYQPLIFLWFVLANQDRFMSNSRCSGVEQYSIIFCHKFYLFLGLILMFDLWSKLM